ncbi:MAG: hypothetical protein C9356_02860 [Oleiphilus sp.]|jgi:hypothetical protein|nr:MAG: hypothetical protein C9356_02860 [Oleiphilus sp.]
MYMPLAVFSWRVAMSKLPRKDKANGRDGAMDLKTHGIASHNHISPDERLIRLVKLMARRAAEADFNACVAHRPNRGGLDHDTTH